MIHQFSDVCSDNIGENTYIWQYSIILKGAIIGNDCNICSHCFIENDVVVGDRVTIKNGSFLYDGVRIENDVFIGPKVVFTNDIYPRSQRIDENRSFEYPMTFVDCGASIGAGAIILPGIKIGAGAIVGAGSIVTHDVLPNTIVFGEGSKYRRMNI